MGTRRQFFVSLITHIQYGIHLLTRQKALSNENRIVCFSQRAMRNDTTEGSLT